MDEDRLTPVLGRLIDAAKAAAATADDERAACEEGEVTPRVQGWAVLAEDGEVYSGRRLAGVLGVLQRSGTVPEAAAFAVAGEPDDTLLPSGDWLGGAVGADPHLPVAVKYLGRWVVVTLEEIPSA